MTNEEFLEYGRTLVPSQKEVEVREEDFLVEQCP